MVTLVEAFPHQMERVSAKLTADAKDWYIDWWLHGPDNRYNSDRRVIFPSGYRGYRGAGFVPLDEFEQAAIAAQAKLNVLIADKDLIGSDIEMPMAQGFVVRLNKPFGTGVYCGWRRIFCSQKEYRSFLDALTWCRERGPLLVEKCRKLSA